MHIIFIKSLVHYNNMCIQIRAQEDIKEGNVSLSINKSMLFSYYCTGEEDQVINVSYENQRYFDNKICLFLKVIQICGHYIQGSRSKI